MPIIQTRAKTVKITEKDKAFKGTEYAKSEFSIDATEIPYSGILELEKANENNDNTVEMIKEALLKQITGWTGFDDENGKEIKFSKTALANVFAYTGNIEFAALLVTAINEGFMEDDKVKKK